MSKVRSLLGDARTAYDGGLTFVLADGAIDVEFPNQRRQRVRYVERNEMLVLASTVATRSVVEALGHEPLAQGILSRNRVVDVVRFGIGARGRLEAVYACRAATLQVEELKFYLATVAREADRLERLLTGKDKH